MHDVSWQRLGQVAPENLADARLQLHHAAQIVAAVGATLLEPRPDDSHPNLGWHAPAAALVGHATPLRAGLRPADLHLLLLDSEHAKLAEFALDGHSWEEARSWLVSALAARNPEAGAAPRLKAPGYDLPKHPVASGAAFRRSPAPCFEELARAYANAAGQLDAVARVHSEASPLRCWPHHFDLATLLSLDPGGGDPESSRSIGVGFSPGDGSFSEPYYYVTPWPYPEAGRSLPDLEGEGQWHREGFVAAVLPLSRLITADSAETQRERCRRFLEFAVAACRSLLA